MQSKNKPSMKAAEREYVRLVKLLPCSVCDEGGGESNPSECHEMKQGQWFTSMALCESCHRSPLLGIHGQKRIWSLMKMDELDALAITIQRIMQSRGKTA